MHTTARRFALIVLLALAPLALPRASLGAPVQLTPEQQKAADGLKAKGGSVMQVAADTDALVVNLGLAGKAAGDAEVALVKSLPKVVELDLHGTGVTDAGLASLDGFKDLTHLRLDRTGVTDAGLAHVKNLPALVYLNLYETAVTDAGLEHLKGIKSLKRVYLWQTKVTDAGADALRKALPEATVNRGEGMAALAAVTTQAAAAAAAAAPAAGGAGTPVAGKPINTICPVSGKPVDPTKLVVYEGKTIGFCCEKCPVAFQKTPKKFIGKIPEFTTVAAAPAAPAAPNPAPAAPKKPDAKPDAKPGAGDMKPDAEGFIRAWLLLAPIPVAENAGGEEIDKEQVDNEKDLKPKEGDTAKAGDKELTWKPIKAADYYFDVNEILGGQNDNAAAYAVVYVDAEAEKKDLHLLMSSNDQGKVYLNGKELAKNTAGRGIDKDQDKAEGVTLNKGTNVLVLKVINEANNFQGGVRFTDKDGKPVRDLKLKLTP